MSPARILIAEDEPAIAETLVYALRDEGFAVEVVNLGQAALSVQRQRPADLLILDVGLPDLSGFEVCKSLRRESEVPVLFLTARHAEVDRIVGLEIGGDDYVTKPFSPREVAARVKAILKRLRPREGAAPTDDFQHDAAARRIRYQGTALELTVSEYRLLACLLEHPGRIYTRAELLDRLALPAEIYDRSIDGHIKTLRAKLKRVDGAAEPVETHRGLGYSLKAGAR